MKYKITQLAAALIIIVVIFALLKKTNSSFENLALGTQTISYSAKNLSDKPIHFLHIDSTEKSIFDHTVKKNQDSALLILGNSQTHSINQYKPSQVNFVELLNLNFQKYRPLYCFSFPNANLVEFYVTLEFVLTRIKLNSLFLPVFMDDLREEGIRFAFFSELYKDQFKTDGLTKTAILANQIINSNKNSLSKSSSEMITFQDKSEKCLNDFLNKKTSFWKQRENVRGNLFNWLYMLRNTIFGIRPNTIRRMIPITYKKNMQALDDILKLCKYHKIRVYMYIPPIRSDVPWPYDKLEYEIFYKDVNRIGDKYQIRDVPDYSKIIPGKYWGYKDPTNFIDKREIDYMHFQYEGHKILADTLTKFLLKNYDI